MVVSLKGAGLLFSKFGLHPSSNASMESFLTVILNFIHQALLFTTLPRVMGAHFYI